MTTTETRPDERAHKPDGEDHYPIAEAVRLTGMTAHTLRWYERIGLLREVGRNHNGERRYRNTDLDWLGFISRLRATGMPVAQMKRYAELVWAGEHTSLQRRDLLLEHRKRLREQLEELRSFESVLDWKIDFYWQIGREEEPS